MPTILKLPCAGSIENINCKLHCIKPAPKGRYLDTCAEARVVDGTLRAKCRKRDGTTVVNSALKLPCPPGTTGEIYNADGKLYCATPQVHPEPPAPPPPVKKDPPPPGKYLESCKDAGVVTTRDGKKLLSAMCTNSAGKFVETLLGLPCTGTITVMPDGRLFCVPPPSPPKPPGTPPPPKPPGPPKPPTPPGFPPSVAPKPAGAPDGPYRMSCVSIGLSTTKDGQFLYARCKNASGALVDGGFLKLPCNGTVENRDGKLVCR